MYAARDRIHDEVPVIQETQKYKTNRKREREKEKNGNHLRITPKT